jgi:hypothetical protein
MYPEHELKSSAKNGKCIQNMNLKVQQKMEKS